MSAAADLNLKQVAARLGLHYMTVYRYVRQGRLDGRFEGGGWLVSEDALTAFVGRDAATPPEGEGVGWAERLERCLLSADETAAWRVLEGALAAGRSPTYCYVEMIAAALARIGERWAAGELGIAEPHLAAAVTSRLVARLGARFRRPGRARGTAVFGAPPGERHSVPIAIVSDLVRLAGYDVLELGADIPAAAFAAAAENTPRLVCIGIGITQPENLPAAQLVVDAVREVDRAVPIVLGGLAATTAPPPSGVDAIAPDGPSAVALVARFAGERALRAC